MSLLPAFQTPLGNASTIAAAGTTQGTATALNGNTYQAITSGTGGVAWPAVFAVGQSITLVNETSLGVNIYPSVASSSVVIDAIAVNTPYFLPAAKSVTLTAESATQLYSSGLSDLLPETSVNVASATATAIGNSGSRYVKVTGTTTITSFDTVDNGITRDVEFTGILTLTNGANLALPGGANITTAAGDTARFKCEGGSPALWRCLSYNPASGKAVVQAGGSSSTGTFAAAGSTQAGATALTAFYATVTSSTAGSAQGVALPIAAANVVYTVSNQTANSIYVYPVNGGSAAINALSANTAYIISAWGSASFNGLSATQWYTSNEKNPVTAFYYMSTNQTVAAQTQLNADTKVYDSHAAVTTGTAGSGGTWKFTAPRPGITKLTTYLNNNGAGGETIGLYKNGSFYAPLTDNNSSGYGSASMDISLIATDFIDIRQNPGSGSQTYIGNASLSSTTNPCWIQVFMS